MFNGPRQDDLASWSSSQLAQRCAVEQDHYHQRAHSDDRYCLALFLRAIHQRDEQAWALLYQQFSSTVLGWLRQHTCAMRVLEYEEPDAYVTDAFQRFWRATTSSATPQPRFLTLASALAYLRTCIDCAVQDKMRQLKKRQLEESLDTILDIPAGESFSGSVHELWTLIERALPDRRERRLVHLLFVLGYEPRDLVRMAPKDFPTAQEVYRLTRNVLDRLRRNPALRAWLEEG